ALRRAQAQAEDLRRALDEREQAVQQWKQAYEQAAQLARTRDADAKQLDQQQQALSARAETCERDNGELVGIGEELLGRYRDKGVWAALRDSEPVTGIPRVRLEALAQQYHARIVDLKARPPAAAADAAPPQNPSQSPP
ncbi:MAG: hypothetical protein ACREVL_15785, partial [Solimonas sp.]